jgi:prepilin-type N-terminal cleavage/methylation domain-containing protein/prepilin-type processing-associated H-X9-DG protein
MDRASYKSHPARHALRWLRAQDLRYAFTLIELLIVIAIIFILIGLTVPAVQRARESASRIQCSNNLKQIGIAIHLFHDSHGFLPPNRIEDGWATWAVLILPSLDCPSVYSSWDLTSRYHDQSLPARLNSPVTYFCPSRRSPGGYSEPDTDRRVFPPAYPHTTGGLSDYAACVGTGTGDYEGGSANGAMIRGQTQLSGDIHTFGTHVLHWRGRLSLSSITDGTSQTLFIGEKYIVPGLYGSTVGDSAVYNGDHTLDSHSRLAGRQLKSDGTFVDRTLLSGTVISGLQNSSFGGPHPGMCNFLLGDGSVRSIQNTIPIDVLSKLACRNDGEAIADF